MSIQKTKNIIEIHNLTKSFGSARGVAEVTLRVPKGSVYGFLGPNGAGKTTTINMLMNLTKPTSGEIRIFGHNNQRYGKKAREKIGFVASDMALDGNLTGKQQLEYFMSLRGISVHGKVKELAERLHCDLTRKIKTLSRGNRQKVALIAALMHSPELLILDEPTSGLDPIMQNEFNKIIKEFQKNGGTTFISSHVLSEVQTICDQVAFIKEGKLIVDRPLKDIVRGAPKVIRLTTKNREAVKQLQQLKGIADIKSERNTHSATYVGDMTPLLRRLGNLDLEDVVIEDADLEDIFSSYYEVDHV